MANILSKPLNKLTKNMTELERQLGVDIKLSSDGDLELNNIGDFNLVSGVANAAQAAYLKLFIEPGGLVYHPYLGTNLQIGEKIDNALKIQTQIIRSLSRDERFNDVNASVQIIDSTILVNVTLVLADSGLEVPLKFAVLRK